MPPANPGNCVARTIAAALRVVLLLWLACAGAAFADTDGAQELPSLEGMERQLATYRAANPEDPQNAKLVDIYLANVQNLRSIADNRESRQRFEELFQEAPQKVARYTAELKGLQRQARSAKGLAQGVALARLEKLLRETRARLNELRADELALQGTANTLQGRIESARQEMKASVIAASEDDAPPPALAGESAAMTKARTEQWLIDKELHASLLARLETELRTIPERLVAVQARLKLVTAQREQTERFLTELLGIDNLKRIGEAQALRDEVLARVAAAASGHPEIVALGRETAALAAEYVQMVTRSESIGAEVISATEQLAEITGAFESISQQLEIAALSDALGPVLMEQYRKLDGFEQPGQKLSGTAELLSHTRLREFQVARELSSEVQLRERVYRALELASGLSDADRAAAIVDADHLMGDRSTLLDALSRTYVVATGQIVDLEEAYRSQSEVAAKFRELLDRNLVWMKSHDALRFSDLYGWPAATLRLLAAQDWRLFATQLQATALAYPASALLSLLVLLVVTRYRVWLEARLVTLSLRRVGWRNYRYRMALEALGIHLLVALPVPLLLAWAGWLLSNMDASMPLAQALGDACYQLALLSYLYLLILEAMDKEGFARQHLRWKAARVQRVESLLRTGIWIMLPMSFFSAVMNVLSTSAPLDQSYRVTSTVVVVAFFVFLVLIARAGRGMFDSAFYSRSYPLLARVGRILLFAVIVAEPLVVILDVQGYHFTAQALQLRIFVSIVVLVLAKMLLDAGLLGLTIAAQRSISAHQSTVQEEAQAVSEGGAQARGSDVLDDVDLEKMNSSAMAMLQVVVAGLAALLLVAIWQQFFTALSILDTVSLWSYADVQDGKEVLATVSMFDLGSALLLLVASLVLASGLPALLGIVFFSFITEKGVLFAIQTVIRYVVGVVGAMIALQMLGFGWSKLQWMAAGLSVGVGFGMQAIFANFFSGLIMLFERPVRIGDVITLGEFSGTIQRIRMRATTITDFDNREIIVPNQMFVTERLINWTLTSPVVRLSFDVGVSYDSDPRQVRETLLEILQAEPRVLADPAPNVIFREFGASTLNMRCFGHVEDVAIRFQVQNDLHMRITEVFREKGIEIAYPQMDLHLRSVDEGARLKA